MCPVALGIWGAMKGAGEQWRGKERLAGWGVGVAPGPWEPIFPDKNWDLHVPGDMRTRRKLELRGGTRGWLFNHTESPGRSSFGPSMDPFTLTLKDSRVWGPSTQGVAGRAHLSSWGGCWLYQG